MGRNDAKRTNPVAAVEPVTKLPDEMDTENKPAHAESLMVAIRRSPEALRATSRESDTVNETNVEDVF